MAPRPGPRSPPCWAARAPSSAAAAGRTSSTCAPRRAAGAQRWAARRAAPLACVPATRQHRLRLPRLFSTLPGTKLGGLLTPPTPPCPTPHPCAGGRDTDRCTAPPGEPLDRDQPHLWRSVRPRHACLGLVNASQHCCCCLSLAVDDSNGHCNERLGSGMSQQRCPPEHPLLPGCRKQLAEHAFHQLCAAAEPPSPPAASSPLCLICLWCLPAITCCSTDNAVKNRWHALIKKHPGLDANHTAEGSDGAAPLRGASMPLSANFMIGLPAILCSAADWCCLPL